MTDDWQPGAYEVAICADGDPIRMEAREGLVCGAFAIGPGGPAGAQLVHIATGQVVAESERERSLMGFHEALLIEFGALDWHRRDLAALTTADQYIRAQLLRRFCGCGP